MTRDIKFRAWNRIDKIMGGTFTIGDWCGSYNMSDNIDTTDIDYMQFTGKVLNGVPVFEGDIIEFDQKEWGGYDNIFVVEWDSNECRWSFGGGGGSSDDEFRKVIGNKFQNHELLPYTIDM